MISIRKISESVFEPASSEEVAERKSKSREIEKQELVQRITNKMVGGVYPEYLDLYDRDLGSLEFLDDIGLKQVNGFFSCAGNNLTSLKGCPKIINGTLFCFNNKLTTLEYFPEIRAGGLVCTHNLLTDFESFPTRVSCDLDIGLNNFINLKKCPTIGQSFSCNNNKLENLEGCQSVINGSFDCTSNFLSSLRGGPHRVSQNYICDYNEIETLEGFPEYVGRTFQMYNNYKVLFTPSQVRKVSRIIASCRIENFKI